MSSGPFKNINENEFTNHIYLIYMYKEDLALNNLEWLICHKTIKSNHNLSIYLSYKNPLKMYVFP